MDLRSYWDPVPGYLDAASMGLPPRAVLEAMAADLDTWRAGGARPAAYDEVVRRARAAFARLVQVGVERVAVGPQVSVLVGLVAANLPAGARVVVPSGEFTSVTYPFLVHDDRDVQVDHVPLAGLADAVRPGVDLVAFSLAQSADGTLVDADAVLTAAEESGTIVVADLTQAAGWLPVDAGRFDVTVTGAYKWLCAPRGSAFLTVAPHLADRLRPMCAGWYAGESVWASVYGPAMALAGDARRFDTSPAWPVWVGTAPAVELFAGWMDDPRTADVVRHHGARLADRVRASLSLEPQGRPVVALPDPDGTRRRALESVGCRVAGRAGMVRLAFHLWNDEADADRAAAALSAP
ncbi:aminotransferase class V-fold PLP-dependent enzyme [Isoptericola sp. b441]|uniref:Aminotransferase class V-fold PLP-dependent enzyme n=1 Tax=Actinotalea lenta TaxID=3064654 RepID=A0ABT9DBQ1_9CELL|nr:MULTISPECIES: aminotransferase class V-fold PLP-dependent enzyme [unclassified Isoptericola]MDO8108286.1 aminotransferase class V-fold PLP-dependent enzyme [Isoptericola sp. b441]MDO8120040.1 aminotransferase class V-fold PLP-dependent enzyme [Isoptericola sp. b490]